MCVPHFCFFVLPLMDTWAASTFGLLWIILLWACVYNTFKALLSVLWGIYSEVELLDHMIILFLIVWGTATQFSAATVSFYFPTSNIQGFQSLHILTNNCDFLLFDDSYPNECEVVYPLVSICISLLITWCWISFHVAICISSLEKYLFNSFTHFSTQLFFVLLVLFLSCRSSSYILDFNFLSNIWFKNISSNIFTLIMSDAHKLYILCKYFSFAACTFGVKAKK